MQTAGAVSTLGVTHRRREGRKEKWRADAGKRTAKARGAAALQSEADCNKARFEVGKEEDTYGADLARMILWSSGCQVAKAGRGKLQHVQVCPVLTSGSAPPWPSIGVPQPRPPPCGDALACATSAAVQHLRARLHHKPSAVGSAHALEV